MAALLFYTIHNFVIRSLFNGMYNDVSCNEIKQIQTSFSRLGFTGPIGHSTIHHAKSLVYGSPECKQTVRLLKPRD